MKLNMIKQQLLNLAKFLYRISRRNYKIDIPGSKYRMLVSYLSEPFYKRADAGYMNRHQNRGETLLMADILSSIGISCEFGRLDKPFISLKGYNVVFGVEPNFIKACKDNPNAVKIYYATGAYYAHQNEVVKKRTDEFNDAKTASIPYVRLADEHNACELADYIVQIGSKYTISTYPPHLQTKIITIRQSCHDFKIDDFIERKVKLYRENEFIWMGSKGSILKGIDIVLDYFLANPNKTIHIVGPIDKEVFDYYMPRIKTSANIKIHGYLDLDSDEMRNIALTSYGVIMPSSSEGGCPGSVINMMKLGCVPIVSKYAAFDEICDYGYVIEDFSVTGLEKAILEVENLGKEQKERKMRDNFDFANANFNKQIFAEDFKSAILRILSERKC